MNTITRRGFALPLVLGIIALIIAGIGVGYYANRGSLSPGGQKDRESSTADSLSRREVPPAVPAEEMCHARCREQYGGSGSSGFEACIRACGAAREETGNNLAGETSAGGERRDPRFFATVLAGTASPLLDFKKSDYDAAVQSDTLVVLYFYADWCPICKEEFPKMQAAFNELASGDVIGFRVNYRDQSTDKDEETLARTFGVGYQHTKVFLREGKVILKAPDSWEKDRYLQEIHKAL